jgi:hypothetical protein
LRRTRRVVQRENFLAVRCKFARFAMAMRMRRAPDPLNVGHSTTLAREGKRKILSVVVQLDLECEVRKIHRRGAEDEANDEVGMMNDELKA